MGRYQGDRLTRAETCQRRGEEVELERLTKATAVLFAVHRPLPYIRAIPTPKPNVPMTIDDPWRTKSLVAFNCAVRKVRDSPHIGGKEIKPRAVRGNGLAVASK